MVTGRTAAPTCLELHQPIAASRAALWRACATVEGLAQWQGDRARGTVRPGEQVELSWPALGASVVLDVTDVAEGDRVAFENGQSRVELRVDEGAVTLLHAGLDSSDDIEGFESSWRLALSLLRLAVERYPRRRRRAQWFVQEAKTSPEAAYALFTDADALGLWLTREGAIGPAGSPYALTLQSGEPMTGQVLSQTPGRDVALSWDEGNGAVVFRTLPSPRAPGERLVAVSTSFWDARAAPSEHFWETAVMRLARLLSSAGAA